MKWAKPSWPVGSSMPWCASSLFPRASSRNTWAVGQSAADIYILTVDVVGSGVLHDAGDLGDEAFVVPCSTEKVKAHLHARRDAPGGDDPPGVDDASSADAAGRGDVGQPVDGDLAVGAGLDAVGLLAIGGRQLAEKAHPPVDPRAGAHTGQ